MYNAVLTTPPKTFDRMLKLFRSMSEADLKNIYFVQKYIFPRNVPMDM